MDIRIQNADSTPLYEQVARQIQKAILAGELPPGAALPSIRGLAKDLRLSVITTKRAYEELERAGLIATVPGKGSFVCESSPALLQQLQQQKAEEALAAAVMGLKLSGMPLAQAQALLEKLYKEETL